MEASGIYVVRKEKADKVSGMCWFVLSLRLYLMVIGEPYTAGDLTGAPVYIALTL